MTLFSSQASKPKADKLKKLLDQKDIIVMPGCYDALSAKLIEKVGGKITGFAFIIELTGLNGIKGLSKYNCKSLVKY